MVLYACDFGAGKALAFFGPDGLIDKKLINLPRVMGGRLPWMEFPMYVEALMRGNAALPAGDVVVESPTTKSSGCEPRHMDDILARNPGRTLYTITARDVKNYRKDHPEYPWKKGGRYRRDGDPYPAVLTLLEQCEVHEEDALIIYLIATQMPWHLHKWTSSSLEITRKHKSVRPMDKYAYTDDRSESYMRMVPPYEELPTELREVLGVRGKNKKLDYSRSMVVPFAMATEEAYLDDGPREERRRRYEKIIGLYARGYPSFYRKAVDVWLEVLSKQMTGKSKREDITREERKAAQKVLQRQIRWFFHLTMAHQGR